MAKQQTAVNLKDREWRCERCKLLLGLVDQEAQTLRVKYKDLYITFRGGEVTMLCRRCATANTLTDTEFAEQHAEQEVTQNAV